MRINSNKDNPEEQKQTEQRPNSRSSKRMIIYGVAAAAAVLIGLVMATSTGGSKPDKNTTATSSSDASVASATAKLSSDKSLKQVQNSYSNGVNKPKEKADNKIKDFTPQIKKAMAILYNYSSSDTSNISRASKLLTYATDDAVTSFIPANLLSKKAQQQQSLKVTYKMKDANVVNDGNGKYDVAVTYDVTAMDQTQEKVDSYTLWVNHDKISSVTSNGTSDN